MAEKENIEEKLDVKDIYTPLSVAKKEVWRRWNDKELRKKVEDFLDKDMPDTFKGDPKAALFRFIATPNHEFRYFLDLSKIAELNPVYVEFSKDKFCTRNKDKVCLGKITTSNGKIQTRKKIIDMQDNDNREFSKIKTLWGEELINFHHRILSNFYGDISKFDVSQFKKNGEGPYDVYVKFFALFLCHGILFENYIVKDDEYEKKFTNTVILPAIQEIFKNFKTKPLIVPLLPVIDENKEDWMWYPAQVNDQI